MHPGKESFVSRKTGLISRFVPLFLIAILLALTGCNGGNAVPPPPDGGSVSASGESWSKSFGGPENDEAHAVAATGDGGFVFVGTSDAGTGANATGGDFWLNKLDAGGNSELERVIGPRRLLSPAGDEMTFNRARATPDGGFVLVGSVSSDSPRRTDIAVARLDRSGTVVWARSYDSGPWQQYGFDPARGMRGAEAADAGRDVAVAADGYWIVAVSTANLVDSRGLGLAPFSDAHSTVILRVDEAGDVVALNRLTDDAYERSYFRFPPLIRATADGGAALARARTVDGQPRLAVQKLSPDGLVLWTRQMEEIGAPTDLIQTRDTGFLLSGSGTNNGVVAKLTSAGDVEWHDVFNDPDDIDASAYPKIFIYGVTQLCSDLLCRYAVVGSHVDDEGSPSVGYIVLLDSGGALITERRIESVSSALSIDGGGNGTALRVLAHGEGNRLLSEGGTLLMLDPTSLSTLATHPFELGERTGFEASLEPTGPLVLATNDQRLSQLDAAATPALQTVLRESGSREDVATSVIELSAGRYIIAGRTRSFAEIGASSRGTRQEAWVMRFESGSGVVWQRRLAPGLRGSVAAMAASSDGGAVLAGELFGALRAVKLDADGRLQWQSPPLLAVQDLSTASLREVHRTSDSGYVVLGSSSDFTSVVAKLDSGGVIQWSRSYHAGAAQSLHPTADGGFIMSARSVDDGVLAIVQKLAGTGEPQWSYQYSFIGGRRVGVGRIRQAQDGGYLLGLSETGVTSDGRDAAGNAIPRGERNVLLLKLDANGGVTWSRSYGGLLDEGLTDLQALTDGGFVMAGWSDSLGDRREAWLLRLGPDGFVNGGSCNAYLGAIPASLFGLRIPEAPSAVLSSIAESVAPITSVQDTSESAREASAHVIARQCLGPVTSIPEGTPPAPSSFRLTLDFTGQGSGTVRSDPAALECTVACAGDFAASRLVVLDATPAADSIFVGWENCSSTEGRRCFALMNEVRELRVRFELSRPALAVSLTGSGSGLVTSNVAGISCGADCSEDYPSGTSVVLTAAPDATSSFTGWTGCDSTDRQTCTVLIDRRREVSAEFNRLPTEPTSVELRVEMHPESRGIGSITSNPALVNCQVELNEVQRNTGGPCVYEVPSGSTYTIFANPEPGTPTTFMAWSGCDSNPTPNACQVMISTARTVRPRFTAP
jgi:hypothetical protein